MTEPVAYLQLDIHGKEMVHIEKDMNGYETKPLYTADQLHPRVKMTKKQWDEFNKIRNESFRFSDLWRTVFEQGKAWHSIVDLSEKKLMLAWLDDEVVEIVPDKKWFVRSKEPDDNGYYRFRSGVKEFGDYYLTKDKNETKIAYPFDTQEEAEKWTNPLTEAVQLPVE